MCVWCVFQLEEKLLQFHMGNLEFACGSSLDNISSQHWDQNDEYPQFHGPPVLIQDNFNLVLQTLATGVHVVNDCKVSMCNSLSRYWKVVRWHSLKEDLQPFITGTSLYRILHGFPFNINMYETILGTFQCDCCLTHFSRGFSHVLLRLY